jgi:hypothetical protein
MAVKLNVEVTQTYFSANLRMLRMFQSTPGAYIPWRLSSSFIPCNRAKCETDSDLLIR